MSTVCESKPSLRLPAPYFEREGVTLYHGDNCEVLRAFPDACIDLVVTSPPYDNLRTYGGHSWDFEGVAQQLWRVIKPGGVVVWVVADATIDGSETGTSFRQALRFMEIGFRLHDTMIYGSDKPPLTHNRYEQCWEYMFVLSSGKPLTFNPIREKSLHAGKRTSGRTFMQKPSDESYTASHKSETIAPLSYRRNLWWEKQTYDGRHPAPFPEAIARDHIRSWSNEGDTVLDPFSGSGTTLKMARELGRKGIGIEVNADYCEITEKRLAQRVLPLE